jgi:hypothetical protein
MQKVALIFSLLVGLSTLAGCTSVRVYPPMPSTPEVISEPARACPYALCFDDANANALKRKLTILENGYVH